MLRSSRASSIVHPAFDAGSSVWSSAAIVAVSRLASSMVMPCRICATAP
jgi:hypothetical protein